MDFCQGITLHHLPGHTDGLIGMQINMPETGTFFFISDHCHVIENVSFPPSVSGALTDMPRSGATGFPRDGWPETIHPGLEAHSG